MSRAKNKSKNLPFDRLGRECWCREGSSTSTVGRSRGPSPEARTRRCARTISLSLRLHPAWIGTELSICWNQSHVMFSSSLKKNQKRNCNYWVQLIWCYVLTNEAVYDGASNTFEVDILWTQMKHFASSFIMQIEKIRIELFAGGNLCFVIMFIIIILAINPSDIECISIRQRKQNYGIWDISWPETAEWIEECSYLANRYPMSPRNCSKPAVNLLRPFVSSSSLPFAFVRK